MFASLFLLLISIFSYFIYIAKNGIFNITGLILRSLSLFLYSVSNYKIAYLFNVLIAETFDARVSFDGIGNDISFDDIHGYTIQDKFADNINRYVALQTYKKYVNDDEILEYLYMYRTIGEILYIWIQLWFNYDKKNIKLKKLFIIFPNFFQVKYIINMLPESKLKSKQRNRVIVLCCIAKMFHEIIMHIIHPQIKQAAI